MTDTMLFIALISLINVISFTIGAKVGQKVVKGEKIELPKVNPMEVYRVNQEKREAEKKREKMDIILSNIEKYDGTDKGQEDVPM